MATYLLLSDARESSASTLRPVNQPRVLYIGIPAHNEATTIGVLLWRLRSVLADVSREYEVVVYDDASTDETAATLAPYSRVLPLTLLSGQRRLGYAGAVDAIVRHVARTTRYPRRDGLLLLQGDFTDPPALVPEFLRRFEGGADLIIGERSSAGDAPPAVKRLLSASRWVLRPFVGITDVRDLTTSFRLVRISVLRDLIKAAGDAPVVSGDGWSANADFLLRAAAMSRRVETLPVTPTFGVRTRETRRTAWPDAVALAKWGWRRRGDRIVVKVVARSVDAVIDIEEPLADTPVPADRPERVSRRDSAERRPVEREGRKSRPPRDRERSRSARDTVRSAGVSVADGALPSANAGAIDAGERADAPDAGENGKTSTREGRPRRKRGRRDRSRREAAGDPSETPPEGSESSAVSEASESRARRPDDASQQAPGADQRARSRAESTLEPPDDSDDERSEDRDAEGGDELSAVPRRKRSRTRRGRRRRSEDGVDAGGGSETTDATPSDEAGDRQDRDAPRAPRRDVDGGASDNQEADDSAPSARRRRSRRGRRGGAKRRGENGGDGGAQSAEGVRADPPRDSDYGSPAS